MKVCRGGRYPNRQRGRRWGVEGEKHRGKKEERKFLEGH